VERASPGEPGGGRRLPRALRITQGREIRALFQRGKRSRTAHLDVFDSASPVAYSRVGVVVPRYKRSVVVRNLVKRRVREILRQFIVPRLLDESLALDVLVRVRREGYEASFAELKQELEKWLERRCSRVSSSS